eukprot:365535-Chlamydomonas_euryale.AAC.76
MARPLHSGTPKWPPCHPTPQLFELEEHAARPERRDAAGKVAVAGGAGEQPRSGGAGSVRERACERAAAAQA